MWIPPLLVLPLIVYNLIYFDLVGGQQLAWAQPVFSLDMPSGAIWTMNVGDLLVVFALILLLIDTVRTQRVYAKARNLIASILVLGLYAAEFIFLPAAASSIFFACLVMSLVDVIVRMVTPAAPRPVNLPRFEE